MNLQPGDIVLFKGKGLFAKIVRFFTRSNYSHTAMLITDTTMIEANWNKRVNIVDFVYDPEVMEIYRYKDCLTFSQQINIVQSSYEMLDKYYDYLQVLSYILEYFIGKHYNNPFNIDDFIICSELIDKAYKSNMIELVPWRDEGNVSPDDLAKSKEITRIY